MNIKLVTDSTANLSVDYITENDVSVVTLFYLIDGVEYPAFDLKNPNSLLEFYSKLKKKPKVSTSCANENAYYEVFSKAVNEGNAVLYIGLSSGVSATFSSALAAKNKILQENPDAKIYCVDSLTGSFGQGLLIYHVVDMIKQGKSVEECYEYVMTERFKIGTFLTVDDMYFLYQGGRIPSLAYRLGSLVKIKPIINVTNEGKLVSHSRVLSRNQSIASLFNIIKKNIVSPETATVYIAHGNCKDEATSLANKIKEQLKVKEVVVDLLEVVIGAHAGTGAIAVFFPCENRK